MYVGDGYRLIHGKKSEVPVGSFQIQTLKKKKSFRSVSTVSTQMARRKQIRLLSQHIRYIKCFPPEKYRVRGNEKCKQNYF